MIKDAVAYVLLYQNGMNKTAQKTWVFGLALSLLMIAIPAFAGDKGKISVRAEILGHLSQTVIQDQSALTISKEDIARGYIDIQGGTVLQVKTNTATGYFLHVGMQENMVREVQVIINGRQVYVPVGGGMVHQLSPKTMQETLQIGYRIFIAEDTLPGNYAWPVSISASLI